MASLPSMLSFAAKRKLTSGFRIFQDSTLSHRSCKASVCLKYFGSVSDSGSKLGFHTSSCHKSNQGNSGSNDPPGDAEKPAASLITKEAEEKNPDVKVTLYSLPMNPDLRRSVFLMHQILNPLLGASANKP